MVLKTQIPLSFSSSFSPPLWIAAVPSAVLLSRVSLALPVLPSDRPERRTNDRLIRKSGLTYDAGWSVQWLYRENERAQRPIYIRLTEFAYVTKCYGIERG